MAKILIHQKHAEIQDEPDVGFLWALDRELSFDMQGAKHTVAYRGFFNKDGEFIKWDGKKRMLSEKLHFPIGLLQRVKEFYSKDDRSIEVVDCRPIKVNNSKIDIVSKLKEIGKDPYYYQLEAVEAVNNNDCGIIKLPTGSGKVIVSALITANFGKSTMIYVIGKDLLYQSHKLFSSLFNQKIGIVGDGLCEIHDINIVSIWTVGQAVGLKKNNLSTENDDEANLSPQKYKDIREMMSRTKVHIFDECHVAACQTIQSISDNINPEHIYGMSASPWRDDGADMLIECVLGKNIVNISASRLIDEGYLVKPIIKFISVPGMEGIEKQHYQTIYKNYIVNNTIRNSYIVRGTQRLVEQGYQTLVLYNSIAHGQILYEQLKQKLPCMLLSGKDSTEERDLVKKKTESKEIKCVIASKIFDIGVDLPSLSGLVAASSGKSSVRALQRIGRVIRKAGPSKKQAAIIDFLDNAPYLKSHSIERRKIYSSEERFEVQWPEPK